MIDIVAKLDALMESKIKKIPCHTNRASAIGDNCIRRLVYMRTNWQDAKPHNVDLQYIFEEGNIQEAAVIKTLADAGVKVIKQQIDFQDKGLEITGHMDGFVVDDEGNEYPLEIKSMSPNVWASINSYEDLMAKAKKYPWLAKYPGQMQLYLYLSSKETGVLLLKNKSTGKLKQINVSLDYDYAEALLKKAEEINEHVKSGTFPAQLEDTSDCDECAFSHICNPDMVSKDGEVITDADTEIALERRSELEAAKKEYDALDKQLKAAFKENTHDNILCGNFSITKKYIEKSGYTVEPKTEVHVKIKRL